MRSFFNKPAWANTADEPSAHEFYRRSHQTYDDIIKANKQQRREEAAKSALKPAAQPTKSAVRSSKRRRISDQDDGLIEDDGLELNNNKSLSPSPQDEQPARTRSTEYIERRGSSERSDDEGASEGGLAVDKQRMVSPEVEVVEQPPCMENSSLPHRSILSSEKHTKPSPSKDDSSANVREETVPDSQDKGRQADKKDDFIVEILVTSEIEKTRPLIVRRHMSQRFRDIRLAWCARQGFDQKMTDSVYLTWNKRRLFDVTTCKSLDISAMPSSGLDFEDEPHGVLRIHVEAVTDALQRARTETALPTPQIVEDEADEKQNTFHIVLKSPGHGDLRVKVLPRTPVLQIITHFRSKRNISSDSRISLSFDGDILDPNSQLKDYDIADMDLVDVILRLDTGNMTTTH
ncbi:conserved hypothetical protein [Talaromyces stipitatus ATCC 10500]|uniref:Ubiquitin-like domain-containing protein n=1 Tax=Talaromyces stipitatus (strain ATCC 10500 / CBS 375.48 / QM 6759 / NRRL 1006) TaxID=441959 RepID=B8M7D0_TALSN|nr:uncharacterized protein TSTA_035760 [Talaromyces stipitatus ATCC 10500]EED20350.1 conserved hypothetical protein [Talaromyces stipitatus ATCC 10500]